MSEGLIRPAVPGERRLLSELAARSKAYWPHDPSALVNYRSELEVHPGDIVSDSVYVIEVGGVIVGFYGLSSDLAVERLYFLFVEPNFIGRGYGEALWTHAVGKARSRGWTSLTFYADVHAAEKFYERLGCRTLGEFEAKLGRLREMTFKV